jgi:REP element-mobilizing transposase RayT
MKFDRSRLFHHDAIGTYQFITFRTKESLDPYLIRLYELKIDESKKRYLMDRYLDESRQGSFLNAELGDRIIRYYRQVDKKYFTLDAVCVMPNHIHVLVCQNATLPEVLRILKGGAAHIVNRTLDRKGKVWSRDYFDRAIRNEEHYEKVYDYIRNNAIKAGLVDAKKRFWGCYG